MNPRRTLNHWRTFFTFLLIVSFVFGNLGVPTGKVYAQDPQTPTVEPSATETTDAPTVEPSQETPNFSETPAEATEPALTETPTLEPTVLPTDLSTPTIVFASSTWNMTFDYSLDEDLQADTVSDIIDSIVALGVRATSSNISANDFQLQLEGDGGLDQLKDVLYNKLLPKLNFLAGNTLIQVSQQTVAGVPFEVLIEAQPGTGYDWKLDSSDGDVVSEVSPTTFDDRYDGPGTTARQKLTLMSSKTGTSVYRLLYDRSFDNSSPVTRKISIIVDSEQATIDLSDPTPVMSGTNLTDLINKLDPLETEMSAQDVSAQTYPSSWDWRTFSKVSPIRDQKTCGSCWSFATTGIMESSLRIFKNVSEDLSEQFLLSCNVGTQNASGKKYDCTGGSFDALDYYIDELGQGQTVVGAVRESQFGYTANANTSCPTNLTHLNAYNADDWGGVSNPTVAQVKWLVSSYGPVAIGICAGSAFNDYSGGVFSTDEGTCQDHMVDIIGWDDSTQTWLIKNSWGTGWGDNGFMKMKWGISGNQTVAIVVMMSGVPEVPELGGPSGTITTSTPTYGWAASDGATSYTLKVVNAGTSSTVLTQSVPSSYCNSDGICAYQPATSLANNTNYSYYVAATNSSGTSVFGGPLNFYTNFSSATPTKTATSVPPTATPTKTATSVPPTATPSIPAATTVVYPVGDINTASVVFQWKGVAGANAYVFKVTNTDTASTSTYTLGSSCTSGTCTSGTNTFGMSGTHYQITIAAQNNSGTSAYSTPVTFRVLPNLLDTPTITAPTGVISYNAPTYSWLASNGATNYSGKIYEGSSTTATLSFDSTPANANCTTSCSAFYMMGLTSDKTYRFTMQASDGSKYSDIATASFTISTPPSVPILIGPSGEISADTPTFQWNASAGAVSYNLVVTNTDSSAEIVNTAVNSSSCVSGVCSAISPVTLVGKNYQFKISASNGLVSSAFSTPISFYYTTHIPPAKPVMASPSGGITSDKPTFTWAPVTGATEYSLKVTDTDKSTVAFTASVASSACNASLCTYVATTSLLGQNYKSEIYAGNFYGRSVYSDPLVFYYTNHIPPVAPTLLSPNGETNSDTPTYQWNAISGATLYHLRVIDLDDSSTKMDQDVATSNCDASTCSITPAVSLLGQNYHFEVRATNIYGDGDYAIPMEFNYTYHVAPAVPETTAPAGAITLEKATFKWNAVNTATSYQLVVTLVDSSNTVINQTVTSSVCTSGLCSYTSAVTLGGYDYTFKVAAKNIYGQSEFSADRPFWISTHATPLVPILVGPSGVVNDDQPNYQWNVAEGATSYLLKVTETNTNVVAINGVSVSTAYCTATVCSYKPATTLNGQNYKVEVASKNAVGTSAYSEPVTFYYTTHVAPATPDTLVAPNGNIYVEQPTYQWNSVSGATSYLLQVTNSDTSAVVVSSTVNSSSCSAGVCSYNPSVTLTGLNYNFAVKAINSYGNSDFSTPLAFVIATHQPPAAPEGISPNGDTADETPTFTWKIVQGATGYQLRVTRLDDHVVVMDQAVGITACVASTCSITPLNTLLGHEYQFEVKAKNTYGESDYSDALSFTYPSHIPPTAPELLSPEGDLGTKTPTYQWTTVSGATSYLLKVVDTDTEATLINQTVQTTVCDASTCSFMPTIRLTGTHYSFTVTAVNSFGQAESSPFTLTVLLPANTTLLAPTTSQEDLFPVFKWSVVPAVNSYTIKVLNYSTKTVVMSKTLTATGCSAETCETTFEKPLEYGYYVFAVAASNDYGQGDFVQSELFGQYKVAAPVVSAPSDSVYDLKPIIKWKAVKGAAGYNLRIINVDTDAVIFIPAITKACASNDCAYTLTALLNDGNYRLEVIAVNTFGEFSEAGTSTFTYLYHTVPAIPVTTGPVGTVYVQKATFKWTPVARATGYVLKVLNSDTSTFLNVTVPAKNCKGTVCSYTTSIVLNDTDYTYQVASVNIFGQSAFSTAVPFSNRYKTAPDAVTASEPGTTIFVQKPVYKWAASTRASSYLLSVVNTDTSAVVLSNLAVAASYCKVGVCSFTQPTILADGNYSFHVAAVNAYGVSAVSSDLAFTVDYVSAPPAPVLSGPSGTTYTSKPKFTWNASARATGYVLHWANLDQATEGYFNVTTSTCKNNLCAFTSSVVLQDGNYQFEVAAKNAFGQSAYSEAGSFALDAHALSPVATVIGPGFKVYSSKVTFTWAAADRATSYRLIVKDADSSSEKFNGIASASICKNGSCVFTPSTVFVDGNYQFTVSSINANGESVASTPLSFSVSATTVSAVPELIGPTGVTNISQPAYQWKAAGGATGYNFSIVNTGTSDTIYTTLVKSSACKNGICSLVPATNLANGNYKFRVAGTNAYGTSDYGEMTFSVFGFNSQFVKDTFGWSAKWLNTWKLSGGSYVASGVGYSDIYSLQTTSFEDIDYSIRVKRSGGMYLQEGYYSAPANSLLVHASVTNNEISGGYEFAYYDLGTKGQSVYAIFKYYPDGTRELIQVAETTAILEQNWNNLRVTAADDTYSFYINGQLIYTFTDDSYGRGLMGVNVGERGNTTATSMYVDWATLSAYTAPEGGLGSVISPDQQALNAAGMELFRNQFNGSEFQSLDQP